MEKFPKKRVEKAPVVEIENRSYKRLALLLTLLVSSIGVVNKTLGKHSQDHAPKAGDFSPQDKKTVDDASKFLDQLVRALQQNSEEEGDTSVEDEAESQERVTDFRTLQFTREMMAAFPKKDESDHFIPGMIMLNMDNVHAQMIDQIPEVGDQFADQIDGMQFVADETSLRVYVEGQDDADYVYTCEMVTSDDGEFQGWTLLGPSAHFSMEASILYSDDPDGFIGAEMTEAIRKNVQDNLLNEFVPRNLWSDEFAYTPNSGE